MRRVILILFLILVCLLAALVVVGAEWMTDQARSAYGSADPSLGAGQTLMYSIQLLLASNDLVHPRQAFADESVFTIRSGESPVLISFRLEEEGYIRSANAFRMYLIYKGFDRTIQAGDYRLSPSMSALEIAQQIQDATPTEAQLFVLAGWRAEEIAAALPLVGLSVLPEDFMRLVNNFPSEWLPDGWPALTRVEGLLAPGEYTFPRDATVDTVIRQMVDRAAENITSDFIEGFERQGLSLLDAVTLASIVEKEGVVDDERPLIASVYLNRLAIGMKLDADPTAQYARGFNAEQQTWWTNPLSRADLEINSAYNTYVSFGLPPGPICNPAVSALRAVAYPAQTPYYYFRAKCDSSGQHSFAVTYAEHVQNGCE